MVTLDNTDSRSAALDLVRTLAIERFGELNDENTREVLSPEVVDAVFEAAWEHQFDRNRTVAQQIIRDIVQRAVVKVVESDAD
jgi:hypothetical protein